MVMEFLIRNFKDNEIIRYAFCGKREKRDGEMGRWGDGEMGRWGDGEMERRRDGEMERWRDGENFANSMHMPIEAVILHIV